MYMKKVLLTSILLISTIKGYSQSLNDHFEYNSEFTTQVISSYQLDSLVTFEKATLEGINSIMPFYHFKNTRNTKNQYVILMHGLGGNKDYWVNPSMPYLQYTKNLTAIKDSLLGLGYNLLIIDAKFHGERSYQLNFRDPSTLPPMRSKSQTDAKTFYDLYVSSIKEVRMLMDHIENTSADTSPEFNLIGYSMGGGFSLILNTIEERINSVVACVPPMSIPYTQVEKFNWPSELAEKMKAISPLFSATNQKSPVAMLMGKTDFFIPVHEAQSFYNAIPNDAKQLKFYDSGHELADKYIEDVIKWIVKHNKK